MVIASHAAIAGVKRKDCCIIKCNSPLLFMLNHLLLYLDITDVVNVLFVHIEIYLFQVHA